MLKANKHAPEGVATIELSVDTKILTSKSQKIACRKAIIL
jgi:hypothetical protein